MVDKHMDETLSRREPMRLETKTVPGTSPAQPRFTAAIQHGGPIPGRALEGPLVDQDRPAGAIGPSWRETS